MVHSEQGAILVIAPARRFQMRSKRHIFGVLSIVLATSVLISYVEAAEKIQFRFNLQKGG